METTDITLSFGDGKIETAADGGLLPDESDYASSITQAANLSEAQMAQVNDFVKSIDISDSGAVMAYGAAPQKKIADFSEQALEGVRTKETGEIGRTLSSLIVQIKNFDPEEDEKGLMSIFKKARGGIEAMKAKYAPVEKNVEAVAAELEKHQMILMKDIQVLDSMYERNLSYYKEITMYLLAGKMKLREIDEKLLPEMKAKAEASGLPEDAQAASDLQQKREKFDKKLHDLEMTRTISIQMAPQIRLIQGNDMAMCEKIQTAIQSTIPLWKSQMLLALSAEHSAQAVKAQREVSDATNELIKKNAEKLRITTAETARESERAIVDIETLKEANRNIIQSLDEVARAQAEGREKRAEAERELIRIEQELGAKLLEFRGADKA